MGHLLQYVVKDEHGDVQNDDAKKSVASLVVVLSAGALKLQLFGFVRMHAVGETRASPAYQNLTRVSAA
jgi:hypothetical protein